MKTKSVRRKNWMLRIAVVLLVMSLVSIHMVSGIFARYTTSASGSDGAHVAKFQITDSLIYNEKPVSAGLKMEMVPGVPYKIDVSVDNASEVAVEYTIEVHQLTDNLPLKVLIPDADSDLAEIVQSAVAAPYEKSYSMEPDTKATYFLYVVWTPGNNEQALKDMGKVDMIEVELTATQID